MISPDPRMNSRTPAVTAPLPSRPLPAQDDGHERYRERDFGVGYGRSSGYAQARRYAPGLRATPFSVR
jgi:hypothetical protein